MDATTSPASVTPRSTSSSPSKSLVTDMQQSDVLLPKRVPLKRKFISQYFLPTNEGDSAPNKSLVGLGEGEQLNLMSVDTAVVQQVKDLSEEGEGEGEDATVNNAIDTSISDIPSLLSPDEINACLRELSKQQGGNTTNEQNEIITINHDGNTSIQSIAEKGDWHVEQIEQARAMQIANQHVQPDKYYLATAQTDCTNTARALESGVTIVAEPVVETKKRKKSSSRPRVKPKPRPRRILSRSDDDEQCVSVNNNDNDNDELFNANASASAKKKQAKPKVKSAADLEQEAQDRKSTRAIIAWAKALLQVKKCFPDAEFGFQGKLF